MDTNRFEELVARAVEALPENFKERLENVDVVVDAVPSRHQLRNTGKRSGVILLGLYEGVPLTARGSNYGLVTPDKISLFQKNIEAVCPPHDDFAIEKEIGRVVRHEIAHHFGIGDARLSEIEKNYD